MLRRADDPLPVSCGDRLDRIRRFIDQAGEGPGAGAEVIPDHGPSRLLDDRVDVRLVADAARQDDPFPFRTAAVAPRPFELIDNLLKEDRRTAAVHDHRGADQRREVAPLQDPRPVVREPGDPPQRPPDAIGEDDGPPEVRFGNRHPELLPQLPRNLFRISTR